IDRIDLRVEALHRAVRPLLFSEAAVEGAGGYAWNDWGAYAACRRDLRLRWRLVFRYRGDDARDRRIVQRSVSSVLGVARGISAAQPGARCRTESTPHDCLAGRILLFARPVFAGRSRLDSSCLAAR